MPATPISVPYRASRSTSTAMRNQQPEDNNLENMPRALAVVKKEGDVFKLDKELLESVLKRPDVANKKVCVISIAGAYRKGKSFMMNFLLRYLDHLSRSASTKKADWMESIERAGLAGFNWQGGSGLATEGILLWSEPFILQDEEGEEVAVFLMDTQGIFDCTSTVKNCTTIFALSTLLSSITIYNISQVINENDLQQMQLFTEYGQLVMEEHSTEKSFQRLMFLIRDWQCPRECEYGLEGGRSYLDKVLKITSNQGPELQRVRKYINSSFEKIECYLMPHPGQIVATGDFDGNLADIDEKFKEQLRVLMPHLMTEITPKRVNGESITCAQLFDYFQAYSAMFEGDELPEPKSVVQMTAEANNTDAANKARTLYATEMKKLCGGGDRPFVANLIGEHARLKGQAIARFTSIKKIGGTELSDKYRASLEKDIDEAYENFEMSNNAKNVFKSMRTPALLVLFLVVNYCMREFLTVVGLESVSGVFSLLFVLIFLTLAMWTYNRYSGRLREVGRKIDDIVGWAWDVLYHNAPML